MPNKKVQPCQLTPAHFTVHPDKLFKNGNCRNCYWPAQEHVDAQPDNLQPQAVDQVELPPVVIQPEAISAQVEAPNEDDVAEEQPVEGPDHPAPPPPPAAPCPSPIVALPSAPAAGPAEPTRRRPRTDAEVVAAHAFTTSSTQLFAALTAHLAGPLAPPLALDLAEVMTALASLGPNSAARRADLIRMRIFTGEEMEEYAEVTGHLRHIMAAPSPARVEHSFAPTLRTILRMGQAEIRRIAAEYDKDATEAGGLAAGGAYVQHQGVWLTPAVAYAECMALAHAAHAPMRSPQLRPLAELLATKVQLPSAAGAITALAPLDASPAYAIAGLARLLTMAPGEEAAVIQATVQHRIVSALAGAVEGFLSRKTRPPVVTYGPIPTARPGASQPAPAAGAAPRAEGMAVAPAAKTVRRACQTPGCTRDPGRFATCRPCHILSTSRPARAPAAATTAGSFPCRVKGCGGSATRAGNACPPCWDKELAARPKRPAAK